MAETFDAPISLTKKGLGFVKPPGASPKDRTADLIIPAEATLHALHGDLVRVEPTGMYRDPSGRMPPRASGRVVEIIKRARETFVGTVVEDRPGHLILEPDYKRMHLPLEIEGEAGSAIRSDWGPGPKEQGAHSPPRPGDKVLVRLTGWPAEAELPRAMVEEVIGRAGAHEVEMRALVLGQGFHPDFPPGVQAATQELEAHGREMLMAEAERRVAKREARDFRGVPTMTIDPYDAKDFDDALSVQTLPDGTIEVGVHIADVSFFVTPGSALDKEARERATSIYLVDRTIPMLPHILSTDLCSLNPNEDRLAVAAIFKLDTEANVLDKWFGETIIHSDKRYTYEDAQKTLDTGTGDMHAELVTLKALSEKLRAKRAAKGAIEFDTAEVKVRLNEEGHPIAIELKELKATNLLIEDFMLLANESVAEYLSALAGKSGARAASLYRVHDAPDPDRIENLSQLLKVMGYQIKTAAGGKVTGAELNRLLEAVKGKPEEYLVKTATLRSMAKAIYTTKNIGHFGLAFEFYTHFTSPIRRYPDLVIHRLIKSHTGGVPVTPEEMAAFDTLALHASEREVAAAEAERDSIKMKQVEFLASHLGEEFDAVISGVSERGLYVEEQTTHADGMIKITDVGNDYFDYDERNYRLIGRRTHASFQLGNPIRVKLVAARPLLRELDFIPTHA